MSIQLRDADAAPRRRTTKSRERTPAQGLAADIWRLWAPKSERLLDAWAEQERYMSAEECNEGHVRWDFSRVPHTREIMRAYSDAPDQVLWVMNPDDPAAPTAVPWSRYNETIVWMSSAQQAKTQTICCIIGHHITDDPRQILYVLPDDSLRRVFSLKKLAPMLRDTPCLAGKISDNKARDGENTIDSKSFPGGGISIFISSSGNNLRSFSGPIVICDEFDAWVQSANKQGDPFMLALDRQQTFSRKKTFIASTPLNTETSRIEPLYLAGTQEQWHYRCPSCRGFVLVAFDELFDREAGTYVCRHCGAEHSEYEWKHTEPRWIARNPSGASRTFHTGAMTSLLTSWPAILEKYRTAVAQLDAGNIEPYRVFVNSVRGESFQEKGEELPLDQFTREGNPQRHLFRCDVPRGVKLLTMAVDTQDDRVEFEVRGYGDGWQQWGIQYGKIFGHPDDSELLRVLDGLRGRFWLREDGAQLQIARVVWDAMGHHADEVYAYTRTHEGQGVYAIRGGSEWAAPVIQRLGEVNEGGIKTPIYTLGTVMAKNNLYHRLQVSEPGPGFCHWPLEEYLTDGFTPRGYDEGYYAMLQAEKRVKRTTKGTMHYAWERKRPGLANEAWDLMVYNLAAALIYLGGRNIDDLPDTAPGHAPAQPNRPRVVFGGVRI